jgi:protein-tyrosine phosphatase
MNVPRTGPAPLATFQTAQTVVEPASKVAPVELFSHLLGEDAGCVTGLLNANELGASHALSVQSAMTAHLNGEPTQAADDSAAPLNVEAGSAASPDRDLPHEEPAAEPLSSQTAAGSDLRTILEVCMLCEVSPGLWVGSDTQMESVEAIEQDAQTWDTRTGMSVLSAARDPWHRNMLGYRTKSAPEGLERLVARRGNHMALNLIDVRQLGPGGHHYVPDEVIEAGLKFISERLATGDQVIVHCNQGKSRAPTLALLWMLREGLISEDAPLPSFEQLYKNYLPSAGMKEYLRQKLSVEFAASNAQPNDSQKAEMSHA